MAIVVTAINMGSDEEPHMRAVVSKEKARPDLWDRKRVKQSLEGPSVLIPLVEVDETRHDLSDLAQAAFELGRSFEREMGPDQT